MFCQPLDMFECVQKNGNTTEELLWSGLMNPLPPGHQDPGGQTMETCGCHRNLPTLQQRSRHHVCTEGGGSTSRRNLRHLSTLTNTLPTPSTVNGDERYDSWVCRRSTPDTVASPPGSRVSTTQHTASGLRRTAALIKPSHSHTSRENVDKKYNCSCAVVLCLFQFVCFFAESR